MGERWPRFSEELDRAGLHGEERDAVLKLAETLAAYGRRLALHGLAMGHGGNLSARRGALFMITRHGVFLEELTPDDLLLLSVDGEEGAERGASIEMWLHRLIYRKTDSAAVFHVHSPFIVAVSMMVDVFTPIDEEGRMVLGKIPVVEARAGSLELAEQVASLAQAGFRAIIARGHGVFVHASSIRDAYALACLVEHSARCWLLYRLLRGARR